MKRFLAVLSYQQKIDGEDTGTVEIQLRCLEARSVAAVRKRLRAERMTFLQNAEGHVVEWPLQEIIDIVEIDDWSDGEEVASFLRHYRHRRESSN